jgi:hypothetical protein
MKVKGIAVKTINEYVKKKHPEDYQSWINSLSDAAKRLLQQGIISNQWYDVQEAAIEPTVKFAEVFHDQDVKTGAWELGRYSAEVALSGIYKLYVKGSSPKHIISRANRAFTAYYDPSAMETKSPDDKSVIAMITEFYPPSEVIEYRIAGWMEKALELSGCKNLKVEITRSLAKGDSLTEFDMRWV